MITLEPCKALPHPDCDPTHDWFRYSVTTSSGHNSASDYTRGPKCRAYEKARAVLKRLEVLEGPTRYWRGLLPATA